MNETQKKIKEYQETLPHLKERIAAVALLLVMSAVMLTSVSFAWVTLSRAPEVSGVKTTVAANGNLEIALAGRYDEYGDLIAPSESAVGDSSAAGGQTVAASNLTWGNLVNLSDESYGIGNIELRPALLSDYNVNKYPLYGANYGSDGRVVQVSDRYVYTSWKTLADGVTSFFDAEDVNYGVRAISSVKYENITGATEYTNTYNEMIGKVTNAYANAKATYADMIDGKTRLSSGETCISALEDVITVYVQTKADSVLGGSNGTDNYGPYIRDLYEILEIFSDVLEQEGEALLYMANLQVYLQDENAGTETFKTLSDLTSASASALAGKGVKLDSLTTYKTNLTNMNKCLTYFGGLWDSCDPTDPNCATVTWSQISTYVNYIVNITSAELNGMKIGSLSSDQISGLLSAVMGSSSSNKVVITEGILADTEQRLGECLVDHSITVAIPVKATLGFTMSVTVKATVVTDAAAPYTSAVDMSQTEEFNTGSTAEGDAVAKDTYGMAIDLWVRTNAAGSVLTLEGSTIYEEVAATGVDKNGRSVDLYTLTVDGVEEDVYQLTEDGETVWYYADNHAAVDSTLLESSMPVQKMERVVAGYQGVNRIWGEDWDTLLEQGFVSEDSTTQGAGSCYVFYADPSEQVRILDLLDSFTIEFVDRSGNSLATARLNTDNAYAVNGKVTVPLEIVAGVEYESEDDYGSKTQGVGITTLNQNEATLITAIIYLNGSSLENENVLATGEIQGQLNLQFGSSVSLIAKSDEDLQGEYRTITATAASGNQTSAAADSPIGFEYDGNAKEVTVTLTVDGTQPEKITGFFVRSISATQGTRGDSKSFARQEDGTWTAAFSLTTPGTYVFRTLIVDGVEYTLDNCPAVNISGLNISYVNANPGSGIRMTADKSISVAVTAKIDAAPELMPRQVRAQFRSEDGKEFNALMSYDSVNKQWSGTATITSSGTYTLRYLVMDGEYYELSESQQTTLILYLGMRASVYTGNSSDLQYRDGEVFTEAKTIPVSVMIWDDSNNQMGGLTGVNLYYHMSGSNLDQNGMYAKLTWNADSGYYEGELSMTSAGIFNFHRLTVPTGATTSTIYTVKSAPTYTAISPNPPEYRSTLAGYEYQFATDGSACLKVNVAYSNAATAYAVVTNSMDGSTALVRGVMGTTNTVDGVQITEWKFILPAGENNAQDGQWTMTGLYFQNVYVEKTPDEGVSETVYYPITTEDDAPTLSNVAEVCYHVDVSDQNITAYVVSTVNVAVTKNGEAYTGEAFGVDEDGNVTGAFMDSYEVSGITVTVKDWNGKAIKGYENLVWTLTYHGDSGTYGGYTGASMSPYTETNGNDGESTAYTIKDFTYQYAGSYTTTIALKNGESTLYSIAGPSFTVSSVTPTVAITAISPTGTYSVDNTTSESITDTITSSSSSWGYYTVNWSINANHKTATSQLSLDGLTADVYFRCYHADDTIWTGNGYLDSSAGIRYHYYYSSDDSAYGIPQVTIKLSNLDNFTSATLNFSDSTRIYSDVTYTGSGWAANGTWETTGSGAAYSWTSADTTVTRYIGYSWNQKLRASDAINAAGKKKAAGTITADTLTVVSGGQTYTFSIPKITINNPY